MGQDWISTYSPDLVACDRCGARTNIGNTVRESFPGVEGIDRTRMWNWSVHSFAERHRSCKEVE